MKIAVRTYAGLEEILQSEIESITNKKPIIQKRAVSLEGEMEDPFETRRNKHLKLERLLNREVTMKQGEMEKILFSNPKMTQRNLVSIKSIQRKYGQSAVQMGHGGLIDQKPRINM